MESSNKGWVWGLIALIVVAGGWWLLKGNSATPADNTPIKIGVIAPLTGDLAFIGEAVKNGANLAIAKISTDSSIKHKYELVFEDDSFDAKKSVGAANKLISIDHVDALISVGSGPGNVVAPIAEQNKIPHIGMASDVNVAKGDYNFIDWTQPEQETTALVAELQRRHLSRLALIGVNQQGYNAIVDDLKKKIAGTNITIVSQDAFEPGTTDFKTMISKAQAKNPDAYYLGSFDPETGILGKQLKALGVKQPLTSIESFGLTADPSIFEGQWFIDSAVPTSDFATQYNQTYSKEVGPGGANAYDGINLLVRAAEQSSNSGSVLHADIAANLLKIENYVGALGALTPTQDGVFLSQASVKIIKGGKAIPVTQ